MYTPFAELPDHARVWVYQANRNINEEEKRKVEDQLTSFVGMWQAHGADLLGSFKIVYDRFVILAVDTATNIPTGCAIDKSVDVLRDLGILLGIDFFDRLNIAFLEEGGHVRTVPMNKLKILAENGDLKPESITFDNLVDTKEKLESQWLISTKDSWMKKYFKDRATA